MTSVSVGGFEVEVEGEGPAVFLVHGLGGSSNSFQALLPSLSGFRCLRPDLPGSARSRLPYGKLTMDMLVRSVSEALNALGGAPCHLVGHSMGTLICQHIAAQTPEAVMSMALFGAFPEPTDAARERLKDRARIARRDGMAVVADAVVGAAVSPTTRSSNPIAPAFVRESHMRQDQEGFAQTCEALAEAKGADLRLVRCPVLLVTGEEDSVGPPSVAHAMAERLKGARVRVLDRCGHWTPIERPIECGKLLGEFVRERTR